MKLYKDTDNSIEFHSHQVSKSYLKEKEMHIQPKTNGIQKPQRKRRNLEATKQLKIKRKTTVTKNGRKMKRKAYEFVKIRVVEINKCRTQKL